MANHVGPGCNNAVTQQALLMQQLTPQQQLQLQQMTPQQQLQLQQMQLQHQAQHLKKLRGRDQMTTALLQQQAALHQQHLQQNKISPAPLRKDIFGGVGAAIQQQLAGQRVGRNIPTAALLQQSTISTSDGKTRVGLGHQGEAALTPLQRLVPP